LLMIGAGVAANSIVALMSGVAILLTTLTAIYESRK